ncbi:MAG: preprotein translocase subunit SecG [Betaproteobacteria bacterium HGW-Betaproteobacteria-11]|nr:MAG: preprotein translocase subunit SecG [Betaproteobacteria bacterium HGW-Betaproteobacteria-11]
MNLLHTIILTIHILAGLGIIALVLLQHGKGADMGAAFGSGASGSLFGATGAANFMSRATGVLATIFFCTSLGLAYIASERPKASGSVMDTMPVTTTPAAPAQMPAAADSKAKDIPK